MPYALEKWGHKAIVVKTMTGHHYSKEPIPVPKAKAQLRLLHGVEHGMIPRKK